MMAGRHRTFNKEDALIRAMEVFWLKGYSGTSLSDLTTAMSINKPSLYAAFGNKEALFVAAIEQYVNMHGIPHFEKLMKPDSRSFKERLKAYLESIAAMLLDSKLPGGCFITASTCEIGSDCLPNNAVETILTINSKSREAFVSFFQEEQAKGNCASNGQPEVLADYLQTILFGLAVKARSGVKRGELQSVISHTLLCF